MFNPIQLKKRLVELRMPQRELGKRIGVTDVTISRYMNGVHTPRRRTIMKIAEAVGVDLDYLMQEDEKNTIKVMLDDGAFLPIRAHSVDAGLDILSPRSLLIPAHGSGIIDTGVHVQVPNGYAGILMSKSGLNVNHNITSEGVIDCGYTGSIVVKLYNHGPEGYFVKRGDKISQLLLVPVGLHTPVLVDRFEGDTERGNNGFGSTGR